MQIVMDVKINCAGWILIAKCLIEYRAQNNIYRGILMDKMTRNQILHFTVSQETKIYIELGLSLGLSFTRDNYCLYKG